MLQRLARQLKRADAFNGDEAAMAGVIATIDNAAVIVLADQRF